MAEMTHEYTVLIAEDDPQLTFALYEMLKFTFDIISCSTVAQVIVEATKERQIHCILLDVKLPNGEGKETVTKLRNQFPAIPIVAMSGFDFLAADMITAGAHDFIRKPFKIPELEEKLINTISRNKAWEKICPIIQRN